jgi:peptidyl-prolyl cis-trans isomerase D
MLESVRQNSRSAIIYILFGILIAAFIVSFGPGSMSTDSMFELGSKYAAKVYGSEISEQDFHFAYIALGAGNLPEQAARAQRVRELIMDRLIERELFAHQAEDMGLIVGEDEAANMVADGKMFIAGVARPIESYAFRQGKLDYDRFRQVVQNSYRITVKQFMDIQRRELLADRFRQLMLVETRAAADEVKADFEDKNRQINLEYVRFSPYRYEQDLAPSDTDVENWARAHEDQIKKAYEERKALYQKQEKSVQVRRILIELKKDAAEPEVAAARAKLDAAKKTLDSGTRFADVARTMSEDQASRGKGGDLGWRKKGFTDFGTDVENKVFAAKQGDLIGPERTERGLELIKVEGFREGDISLGQARTELATELYRTEKAKELAQTAAQDAANKLKAGGKLADLFPKNDSDSAEAQPRASRMQVEETGLFPRKGDTVQGIGASATLANAAFLLKPGEFTGPTEVSGSYIVAVLKERKEPDMADFDKRKEELMREYARAKWGNVMNQWAHNACVDAQGAGKIKVNQNVMQYDTPAKGAEKLFAALKYEPCREKPF